MLRLHALVDYFNVATFRRGTTLSYSDHLAAVDILASAVQSVGETLSPKPDEITMRLYGGWHSAISENRTEAREILGAIGRKHFPTRRPNRMFLEMADSLVALPNETLLHTHRLWRGLSPFRLIDQVQAVCPLDPLTCPLHELDHWRRGRCPRAVRCTRTTDAVASSERQKLVDTALVADAIILAQETDSWVVPVSNDDDIIPAVLAGQLLSKKVLLLRIGKRLASPYDAIIERSGIATINLTGA